MAATDTISNAATQVAAGAGAVVAGYFLVKFLAGEAFEFVGEKAGEAVNEARSNPLSKAGAASLLPYGLRITWDQLTNWATGNDPQHLVPESEAARVDALVDRYGADWAQTLDFSDPVVVAEVRRYLNAQGL